MSNLNVQMLLQWDIEPLFCDLKQRFGWKDCRQQSARLWQRWIAICSVSYAFTRLVALLAEDSLLGAVSVLIPWRKEPVLTAG